MVESKEQVGYCTYTMPRAGKIHLILCGKPERVQSCLITLSDRLEACGAETFRHIYHFRIEEKGK